MQDLSKKIPFLRYRKLLWKSYPYKLYLKVYEYILLGIIKRASSNNLKVIFINGMRRSGNHFLMNTLLNSTDASVIFFNNHPKKSQLTIDGGVQTNFKNKRILVIIGFEDLQIKEYEKFSNIITKRFFENKISKKLVVLRDARNIMASRLNHAHMHKNLKTLNTQEEILYNNILLLARNKLFFIKFFII